MKCIGRGLVAHPLGQENYELAKREQFLLREDRIFLKLASTPHIDGSSSHFSTAKPRCLVETSTSRTTG